MRQRTITAVFFVVAMIGGIYGGPYTFFLLFTIIALGCLWELGGLLLPKDEKHYRARRVIGCILGMFPVVLIGKKFILGGSHAYDSSLGTALEAQFFYFILVIFILGIIFVFLAFLFELFSNSKTPFQNLGTYVLGIFYIGAPIVLLFSLSTQDSIEYHPHRVFGILWLIWTNDTMAYLIGSLIGRTKLFERISPNKTWEGTIGGGLCTVAMAWFISLYVNDFNPTQWLALGGVVAVFGNLGDLVESMLKRSVGVKDSGNLLPGHGGLLDRFDSFIFILPFAWLILQWV